MANSRDLKTQIQFTESEIQEEILKQEYLEAHQETLKQSEKFREARSRFLAEGIFTIPPEEILSHLEFVQSWEAQRRLYMMHRYRYAMFQTQKAWSKATSPAQQTKILRSVAPLVAREYLVSRPAFAVRKWLTRSAIKHFPRR